MNAYENSGNYKQEKMENQSMAETLLNKQNTKKPVALWKRRTPDWYTKIELLMPDKTRR
ncbi:MAG: hypothetical protein K2X27_09800 [Candidatus Obscuribacterales bacterium]|nr:hypothetical protein [Candidatus Obscuribacterales bacterium]